MYLIIIFFPLLSAIASGFIGRKIGIKGSQLLGSSLIFLTAILSALAFYEVGFNESPISIIITKWLDLESLDISWGFNIDSLSVSMLIPVILVSLCVHIYSIGYMGYDPHFQRFFSYLSLFTFFMILLITADNFLSLFVGCPAYQTQLCVLKIIIICRNTLKIKILCLYKGQPAGYKFEHTP